ncbi:MAG: hypothetical protein HY904_21245 [Deltaproteobacteria bacterium]|nr:hypothetical protein [Deltaproteobacteria bacterium]
MIQKNDCDHLNKRCGVPKCQRRAVYWYVNRENRGRNIYACGMHDKEARVFIDTPWPPKEGAAG